MPGDQERRRKLLEKKAAKRKERKRAEAKGAAAAAPPSSRALIRAAATWPLYECWINKNWQDVTPMGGGGLAEIIVARRSPSGQIGAGVFLVDLGCLGVKNAYARVFPSESAYAAFFEHLDQANPLGKADLNLVAKVIEEGIAYAKRFGFRPSQGYYEAAPFLAGAQPAESNVAVPLGRDGKPFYVSGPSDNPKQVIAQLMRTVGEGNFDYIVHVPASEVRIQEAIEREAAPEDEE